MLQRIVRIENAGPDFRARRIFFEHDPDPRTTAAAVIKRLGVSEGMEVDRAAFEASLSAEELPLAKERAIQLLGYRERSVAELRNRLRDGGYPAEVANQVTERFCEIELVDDSRFASAWVRSRFSAGYGPRRIARELAEKGVPPDVAAAAMEADDEDRDEVQLAVRSLRGRAPRDRADSQRLIKRLLGRGFSLSAARSAVEAAQPEKAAEAEALDAHDTPDYLQ